MLVGGAKDDSEESSEFIIDSLGMKPVIIPEMQREINLKYEYVAYKKIKKIRWEHGWKKKKLPTGQDVHITLYIQKIIL